MSSAVVFGMFGLGPMELAIVGVIALLMFGNRLPEVARGMGKSIREFKGGMSEIESDVKNAGESKKGDDMPSERINRGE